MTLQSSTAHHDGVAAIYRTVHERGLSIYRLLLLLRAFDARTRSFRMCNAGMYDMHDIIPMF